MATEDNDTLTGTSGNDLIEGLGGNDTIVSSPGNDSIYGNARSNTAATGESNTVVYAGRPSDYLFAYLTPPRTAPLYEVTKPDGSKDLLWGIQFVRFEATGETLRIEDVPLSGGTIEGTDGNDVLAGRAGNDVILGREGADVIVGSGGSDVINGFRNQISPGESPFPLTDGVYDQVNYVGRASDFRFEGGANNTVRVTKPDGGVDTLSYIEGVWFIGEDRWYALADLIEGAVINGGVQSDVLYGTRGNDTISAGAGNDTIVGSNGNDTIDGGGAEYDQVDYAGAPNDYRFEFDGASVRVLKPDGNTDRLTNIDGIWFAGERAWYALADLIQGATFTGTSGNDVVRLTRGNDVASGGDGQDVFLGSLGNDTIRGAGQGISDDDYDQVDYSGRASDYRFTRQGDAIIVTKPDGGTDTLYDIDGFWFGGEQKWYALADVIGGAAETLAS